MNNPVYRGTYVLERQKGDGEYEVLLSASHEVEGASAQDAYDPLLLGVSEKIEKYRPLLDAAEDEPSDLPVEVVPNAPTIRSVETQKEN